MIDTLVTIFLVNIACLITYETCGFFYRKLKRRISILKEMKRYKEKSEISKEEYYRNGRIF